MNTTSFFAPFFYIEESVSDFIYFEFSCNQRERREGSYNLI